MPSSPELRWEKVKHREWEDADFPIRKAGGEGHISASPRCRCPASAHLTGAVEPSVAPNCHWTPWESRDSASSTRSSPLFPSANPQNKTSEMPRDCSRHPPRSHWTPPPKLRDRSQTPITRKTLLESLTSPPNEPDKLSPLHASSHSFPAPVPRRRAPKKASRVLSGISRTTLGHLTRPVCVNPWALSAGRSGPAGKLTSRTKIVDITMILSALQLNWGRIRTCSRSFYSREHRRL